MGHDSRPEQNRVLPIHQVQYMRLANNADRLFRMFFGIRKIIFSEWNPKFS